MVLGIGADIIEIERVTEAARISRFMERCYTKTEAEYCRGKPQSLAGLFAAKEAVVKAIGVGFSGFWPGDIEIWHDAQGKPCVRLHGKAAERLSVLCGKDAAIMVSISHNNTQAMAVAIVQDGR